MEIQSVKFDAVIICVSRLQHFLEKIENYLNYIKIKRLI